jgi:hypothetical protein
MRRQDTREKNCVATSPSTHTAHETSSPTTSYGEESDLDDTFDQLDALLAAMPDTTSPVTRKVPDEADRYFNEIVEMLNRSDRESIHEAVISEHSKTEEPYDLFDEILNEIPEDQIPDLGHNANKTSGEIRAVVNEIEEGIDKIIQNNILAQKTARHQKEIELEIADPAYRDKCLMQRKGMNVQSQLDHARNVKNLQAIIQLVKGLKGWTPAKNAYLKIIRDNRLSSYDKVQLLIMTANNYVEKNSRQRKGFLLKILTRKSHSVHEKIAGLDINNHQKTDDNPKAALR